MTWLLIKKGGMKDERKEKVLSRVRPKNVELKVIQEMMRSV